MAGYLDEGFRRIKIKIAPGSDLAYVKAVRRHTRISSSRWTPTPAYELSIRDVFRAMEDENLLLIEQPLGYDDIFDHSKLQREMKTPICLDESIHSPGRRPRGARAAELPGHQHQARPASAAIPNRRLSTTLRFDERARLARRHAGIGHGPGRQRGAGVAAELHAPRRYLRQQALLQEDIVEPAFEVAPDGTMAVPTGPGSLAWRWCPSGSRR